MGSKVRYFFSFFFFFFSSFLLFAQAFLLLFLRLCTDSLHEVHYLCEQLGKKRGGVFVPGGPPLCRAYVFFFFLSSFFKIVDFFVCFG